MSDALIFVADGEHDEHLWKPFQIEIIAPMVPNHQPFVTSNEIRLKIKKLEKKKKLGQKYEAIAHAEEVLEALLRRVAAERKRLWSKIEGVDEAPLPSRRRKSK